MLLDRYKLKIQYDGSKYLGWQQQKKGRTVQGVIEESLNKFLNQEQKVKVHGSGRTDTGVHAIEQIAHVDFNSNLEDGIIKNAMNAYLPEDCMILEVVKVAKNFHSRYDAKKRFYRYQICTKNLLYRNQCWIKSKIDIDFLNKLANKLIGDHDFLSFSKYRKDLKSTNCQIFLSKWLMQNEMYVFKIGANRFLHHMIRYLVGTMIAVYEEKIKEEQFDSLLKKPKKNVRIFKAPPQGLILEKVCYD